MHKFILAAAVVLVSGCGAIRQTEPEQPPLPLRATSLIETYRDFPDRAKDLYTGKTVVVRVLRGHYAINNRTISWFATGDRSRRPALIVDCRTDPRNLITDGNIDLLITGKCVGRVWDGDDRGSNVKFFIRMIDCRLTAVSNPGALTAEP